MTTLDTPRLILRRWRASDIEPFAAVNSDPEVMRYIGDGSLHDEERTREGVRGMEREWEEEGFGLFAVELRESGQLAGFTGLSVPRFLPEVLPAVEIGWRLGRPFWGRGLATEAATAALRFGFGERGLSRVVSIAQIGNHASERVMTKLGMRVERTTTAPGSGRRVRVWEIDAPLADGVGAA